MSLINKSVLFANALRLARSSTTARIATRGLATVADSPLHGKQVGSTLANETAGQNVPAALQLKTGQVFHGESFGAARSVNGEAVFTTSLVGYPESMTDPSYSGQILVFTQPLIGNYGVPGLVRDSFGLLKHFESENVQVSGIVVGDYAQRYSHWNAVESLASWCARNDVPAITGVDTRALVHLLRDQGSTLGQLAVGESDVKMTTEQIQWADPNADNLVAKVSVKQPVVYNAEGDVKIALLDCGVKQNIIRSLVKRGACVTVLPWNYNFNAVAQQYDGLFISNGPGNPEKATEAIDNLKTTLHTYQRPIFGICMGNQLLGLAAGLPVKKLPFGNRGHNQPVVNTRDGRCVITSQNHGYALCDEKMPSGWHRYFVNANDGSNEGIWHESGLFSSVQFHPEAKGGPMDTEYLFGDFLATVRAEKLKREGINVWSGLEVPQRVAQPVSATA
ncbi:small subunit of carbamoyl-phosphate synthase [Syncephalis fuscata]|nr:small subunit of carbamoyl-phosphate synthase [Syncephalis fuscata]